MASLPEYEVYSDYTNFTTTDDYVNHCVLQGSDYVYVTNDNKDSLGIVAGTTIAYDTLYKGILKIGTKEPGYDYIGITTNEYGPAPIVQLFVYSGLGSVNEQFIWYAWENTDMEGISVSKGWNLLDVSGEELAVTPITTKTQITFTSGTATVDGNSIADKFEPLNGVVLGAVAG